MTCFFMYLVDEENIYLWAFELESNFVPVLSYASRGKLRPIIEGLRYCLSAAAGIWQIVDNDMLGVRSGRDADEAAISWSQGCPRWRTGSLETYDLTSNHRVFHGNSQKEACSLTFD